ncbi:type II secretion system protein [Gallaecimonas kandeliae]|uniref:type II secretion system protein n=1 Tax=Gallaecimonas kandeliae TaxID=3029055 RepID=UPI0026477663|nr:type II secretion system protein [Gallaecimonas kandeliae]WKE66021.1 type II secretion system protein [Gallaecimonas kandeliae]
MKAQKGFSFIELVIVIVILGLLAAVALPRFLDVTNDAQDASVEGVAGGFASAVGMVRAEWEVEGRPKGGLNGANAAITFDNETVYVDGDNGYPVGIAGAHDTGMSSDACLAVMDAIMQSSPRSTTSDADIGSNKYLVRMQSDGSGDRCVYYLIATLNKSSLPAAGDYANAGVGNSFTYQPSTGKVMVFNNN